MSWEVPSFVILEPNDISLPTLSISVSGRLKPIARLKHDTVLLYLSQGRSHFLIILLFQPLPDPSQKLFRFNNHSSRRKKVSPSQEKHAFHMCSKYKVSDIVLLYQPVLQARLTLHLSNQISATINNRTMIKSVIIMKEL